MAEQAKVVDVFKILKNGSVITFQDAGINWIWYLTVETVWPHGECRFKILRHWRVHRGDANHPEAIGTFKILENTSRTACAVRYHVDGWHGSDMHAAVENPSNIFSYK